MGKRAFIVCCCAGVASVWAISSAAVVPIGTVAFGRHVGRAAAIWGWVSPAMLIVIGSWAMGAGRRSQARWGDSWCDILGTLSLITVARVITLCPAVLLLQPYAGKLPEWSWQNIPLASATQASAMWLGAVLAVPPALVVLTSGLGLVNAMLCWLILRPGAAVRPITLAVLVLWCLAGDQLAMAYGDRGVWVVLPGVAMVTCTAIIRLFDGPSRKASVSLDKPPHGGMRAQGFGVSGRNRR